MTQFRAADLSDTITAVATAPGAAGVGIVRVSGPQAFAIADQLFRGRSRPSTVEGGRFLYGQFVAAEEVIDEGLCLVFRAPHSYTGDDVIELQSHGSPAVLQAILAATVAAGARLARPGEYTLRAYLAGRLDLSQAEAVLNLVQATTDTARKQATLGLSGALSAVLGGVAADITRTLAAVQAMLDYPEEGVPEEERTEPLRRAISQLEALLDTAQAGRLTQQGARLALIGRPNAGKSSLLNALLGYERSIVTPIAGTTRDYLEAGLELAGLPITLVDTAGLRETDDVIEAQGVVQARKLAQAADLVLYLADGTQPYVTPELPQGVPTLRIQTKCDLPLQWQDSEYIQVSAATGQGLSALRTAIEQTLLGQTGRAEIWLGSERQVQAVRRAHAHLQAALHLPDELASYELEQALLALAELSGRDVQEDVIDAVFSNFCVGK